MVQYVLIQKRFHENFLVKSIKYTLSSIEYNILIAEQWVWFHSYGRIRYNCITSLDFKLSCEVDKKSITFLLYKWIKTVRDWSRINHLVFGLKHPGIFSLSFALPWSVLRVVGRAEMSAPFKEETIKMQKKKQQWPLRKKRLLTKFGLVSWLIKNTAQSKRV